MQMRIIDRYDFKKKKERKEREMYCKSHRSVTRISFLQRKVIDIFDSPTEEQHEIRLGHPYELTNLHLTISYPARKHDN